MATRRYESPAREEAAAAARSRVIDAAIALAYERGNIDMTLDQIASRAGTTVRTILRQFGSRDDLIEAAIEVASIEVAEERRDPGGDADRSIALLVEHYERRGRFVLQILALDQPGPRRVAASGRLLHRAWVEEAFGSRLPAAAARRTELVDLLVVATDVYAWKLLRLDRELDATTTEARILLMTQLLLGSATPREA